MPRGAQDTQAGAGATCVRWAQRASLSCDGDEALLCGLAEDTIRVEFCELLVNVGMHVTEEGFAVVK